MSYMWRSDRSVSRARRWGVCHERKLWAWWRSWTPSPKCLRATWRRRPQEEQVTHKHTSVPRWYKVHGLIQQQTVSVSSTVSLIAFSAMALLAILEFFVYRDTWMKYEYAVDKDFFRWVFRYAFKIMTHCSFPPVTVWPAADVYPGCIADSFNIYIRLMFNAEMTSHSSSFPTVNWE